MTHCSNIYYVEDNSQDDFSSYDYLWDYEWIHFSFSSNSNIFIYNINSKNLQKNMKLVLGGDAIYDVNGILLLDSITAIAYGWRFRDSPSETH